jgi:P27 family predicted phage terminase small subunit
MRGRPRKPTALKDLQGTNRTERGNESEPQYALTSGTFAPPAHLNPEAAQIWCECAALLLGGKVLTDADLYALSMLAEAMADYRECQRQMLAAGSEGYVTTSSKGGQVLSPWIVAKQMSAKRVMELLSKFGMEPSSRSKVIAGGRVVPVSGAVERVDEKPSADRFFPH